MAELEQKPCPYCGATSTGGNLALHNTDCSYVTRLADEYPAVRKLLKNRQQYRPNLGKEAK